MSRFAHLEFGQAGENTRAPGELVSDETRLLGEADTLFRGGYFEQALRRYGRVLESDPKSAPAWLGQVRMLIELGEFAEAALWADKGLEQLPNQPELLAAKGVALARTGDTDAALAFSDAAIGEQGDTPYVWLARGDVLLARSEKRADFCFAKALGAAAGDWLWAWLASRIHLFYRRFALALRLVRSALALDPSVAVVWLQLGRCQLALGLAGDAHQSLAQAQQLDPACPEGLVVREELRDTGLGGRLTGWLRRWWHA